MTEPTTRYGKREGKIVTPEPLREGDRVAIIAPATVCAEEYIDGAAEFLRRQGLEPAISTHCKGPACGTYASSAADRLADFREAWGDRSVRAVLCARGGYGCNHLLPYLDVPFLRSDPKWLIGFSDVSALHAMLFHAGIASLHAPMAKHLSTEGDDHYCTRALMDILRGAKRMEYSTPADARNRTGEARGTLVGGNLAVINGLADTRYDLFRVGAREDAILFIEDIAEPVYKVERVLRRLILAGRLKAFRGLLLGEFTEYRGDRNFESVEAMAAALMREFPDAFPETVAFGFPAGHTSDNVPLAHGTQATLDVSDEGCTLSLGMS